MLHGKVATQCAPVLSLIGTAEPLDAESVHEILRPSPPRSGRMRAVVQETIQPGVQPPADYPLAVCVAAGFDVNITTTGVVTLQALDLSPRDTRRCAGTAQVRYS